LALDITVGCSRDKEPQAEFNRARQDFVRGNLRRSQDEAAKSYQRFLHSNPEWAWKFKTLEAEATLWQGRYEDSLTALKAISPAKEPGLAIAVSTLSGVANAYLHRFSEADENLKRAEQFCEVSANPRCGDLIQARGLLANQQGEFASAEKFFGLSLVFARSHADRFLESTSLLNLGAISLAQGHFSEAIDWSEAADSAAAVADARIVRLVAQGNIGWACYRLGDSDKALQLFLQAEKQAGELGDLVDQGAWLTDIGYVYLGAQKSDLAEQSFLQSLKTEQQVNSREEIYNVQRALARLAVQTGDLERASFYATQAFSIAHKSNNHLNELYPKLVEGQVAARRGDARQAREIFMTVERDRACPHFLKWEAQHSLARLSEDEKQPDAADREYRAALATFEAARSTVQHEDFQLSFLTNAARIYDDYIHFLVIQGRAENALRWADYSRARTLAEGLGLLTKGKDAHAGPPSLSPSEISRRAQGTLLFYWLGEKQSYLWAITPQQVRLFPLPPGAEIDSLVQRYRTALSGPQDVLGSENGRALYRTLIAPAKTMLANNAKVFIIPDGSLNNLNFETLVVDQPKPHYWIEDADVVNASSLRVLAASFIHENPRQSAGERKRTSRLLLIGNSIAPSKEYPELSRAGEQMANVARHFPASQRQVYQRDQANPSAYLAGNPETFSHIHFVAHGTASRLSPLDSAIVLSKGAIEADPFKLYARDIVQHPLHAELVTISACYGAGSRAYSGEGLVGLAWAFLRAGAHNVIASLWEVTDASTEQLMDRFYDELDSGASPDAALRAAKLSLLHGSAFHNPFYWAPFQLYTGS
jgi:CHAT domain-containing protein/tetratricopeptide (TPR) repeat protein